MGKLDKGFAVGAVAAAVVLGGVLYALYPSGFTPGYASENGAASTGYSSMSDEQQQMANSAPQDKSTASQDSTDASTGSTSSPPPSSNPGY